MSYNNNESIPLSKLCYGKGEYGIGASAVPKNLNLPTYLRITDITDNGDLITEGLTSVDHTDSSKYYLEENDIVFARTGASTGRAFFYEKKYGRLVYAGFLIKFSIDKEKVNPKYLKYYTLSDQYKGWVKAYTGGSTRGNINAKTFGDMLVELPPRNQQDFLVKILSSFDDKIELNNKINKNLEELAQTLYKRWFIDFEFPNEDGEPYKSSGGEMVDSELGLIPKSWNINKLCDISEIERGLSYKGKHLCESGVPMINLGSVKAKGGYNYDKIKFYNGDYKQKNVVSKGDIIIANTDMTSTRDILGTPIMVPSIYHGDIIFSHHLYALRKMKISRSYLYYYLKSDTFKSIAENYANGTTVLAIAKNDVEQAPVLIPSDVVLNLFSSIVDNVIDTVSNNEVQNISLTKTRDELLPKLMNGEIEVSNEEWFYGC